MTNYVVAYNSFFLVQYLFPCSFFVCVILFIAIFLCHIFTIINYSSVVIIRIFITINTSYLSIISNYTIFIFYFSPIPARITFKKEDVWFDWPKKCLWMLSCIGHFFGMFSPCWFWYLWLYNDCICWYHSFTIVLLKVVEALVIRFTLFDSVFFASHSQDLPSLILFFFASHWIVFS